MNYITVILAFAGVLCISCASSTRLDINRVVSDLVAGGERLCPYCSLCSYSSYCDGVCQKRPMIACFMCQFKHHCQSTCRMTCKKNPCTPSPCMEGESCVLTGHTHFFCTCSTPACLNKSKVVLQTDKQNPI